jgi:hypothetical protein
MHQARSLAQQVLDKPFKGRPFGCYVEEGVPEVTFFYSDPVTGVPCRARLDLWHPDLLFDLKTTDIRGVTLSPFQARGGISPGKSRTPSPHSRRIYAASPWPQELRSFLPACPARQRLRCDSCPSTRGLRSTLPSHTRSPSCSCASLRSLWPARGRTCTPRSAPMLGAQEKGLTSFLT